MDRNSALITSEIPLIPTEGTAILSINENSFKLPIAKATQGVSGILVSSLRNDGFVTLDPGFLTTAQCESKITYIDGDNSILRYRGIPIEELASHSTFLEVAYLLIYGSLPTSIELENFTDEVNHNTLVGEDFRSFLSAFPRDAHPMAMLSSSVSALETFLPETSDIHNPEQVRKATTSIMAKVRTITSFLHRRRRNEPLLYPDYSRGYVDDFLRMCFATPYEPFESDPLFVEALDRLLILQADHEQNCSTSVMRIVGSADASLYASVSAGINALSGPLHGGANEAAIKMLQSINASGRSVQEYVNNAKENNEKLSGLGHRVYKSYDPRAVIAKGYATRILNDLERQNSLDDNVQQLLDTAHQLEEIVLSDDYFTERGLYPNIDFYTGIVYRAIGFDPEMFTALFSLARIPGWIAHWTEMHADPLTKIGRPRQVYSGETLRDFIPIEQRG